MEMTQWTQYYIWKFYFCHPFVLVYYRLILHRTFFYFVHVRQLHWHIVLEKMAPVTAIMDAISLWFGEIDNALLYASGHSPADKIEEQISFALSHARLYLSESEDERNDKSFDTNIFDKYCGGGVSSSSLSALTVSVSATSDVFCCWIFTSDLFLTNDPLSSYDMVDWDNDSTLVIGGGYTNIDEGYACYTTFLLDGSGMVFDGSGEVRPCIEEACDSWILFCEYLDDCWKIEDIWGG